MAITVSEWIHYVFNFIGPDNGMGVRVYHDGVLVDTRTNKFGTKHRAMDRRIVIGRIGAESSSGYSSLEMDELIFHKQALSGPEIAILSQTNF